MDWFQKPELLATLLERMQDGLSVVDARGVLVYVNDALCRMLGFSRAELIGATIPFPYWPEEERAALDEAFERTRAGDLASYEITFRRKDGSRVEVLIAPTPLRDDGGAIVALFATIKDISERKRLERAAVASEERWRSIAENPFDFVVQIDRDYHYTYVNHTAPSISREDLIGKATPFDFVDPKHHPTLRAAFDTTFGTGRPTSYEVYVPQLDAWYSNVVGPVFEEGRVVAVSILTRDVTAQKRAEEALRRSDARLTDASRLETIGTLASGIAHDINNVLTPIIAYAELAQATLPVEHDVQEYLHGISAAGQRARQLVRRILLLSRKHEPKRTTFDLRQIVREDVTLLRAFLSANIDMVAELPEQPVLVHADPIQVGQVLTNLATNAIQAMRAGGGRLTIALDPGTDADSFAKLHVRDTGPGMDAETARRAFEPFFTTKAAGVGTGLGLSIVDRVVREHGGDVTLRSAPGEGATFTVRIPVGQSATAGASATPAPPSMRGRSLKVIVVDDEPAIGAVTRRALTTAGHVVTLVVSAAAALDLLAKDPDAFDILLTDESMPNMSGTSLLAELRAIAPRVACLLMTGRGDETTREVARSLGVLEVIAKPFSVASLLAAVERAGARHGGLRP